MVASMTYRAMIHNQTPQVFISTFQHFESKNGETLEKTRGRQLHLEQKATG